MRKLRYRQPLSATGTVVLALLAPGASPGKQHKEHDAGAAYNLPCTPAMAGDSLHTTCMPADCSALDKPCAACKCKACDTCTGSSSGVDFAIQSPPPPSTSSRNVAKEDAAATAAATPSQETSRPPIQQASSANTTSTAAASTDGVVLVGRPHGVCAEGDADLTKGPHATVRASTFESSTFRAELAIDGDASTRWGSEFADNQWIEVGLGGLHEVARTCCKL